jgi:hypothetical protein
MMSSKVNVLPFTTRVEFAMRTPHSFTPGTIFIWAISAIGLMTISEAYGGDLGGGREHSAGRIISGSLATAACCWGVIFKKSFA